jgi:hypothetical protein
LTEPTTYSLTIENISATDAIALKQELVQAYQLVDGVDFTWSWWPEVLDEFSYFQTSPRRMEVRFVKQSNATFFELRFVNASR